MISEADRPARSLRNRLSHRAPFPPPHGPIRQGVNMTGRRLIALFSLLALVLLFSAGRNATVSQAAPAAGHHFVRVAAADIQAAAQVGLNPVRAFDYGAFQWLELTDADFTRLAASGAAYTEVLDAGYVHVPGYRFDPLLDGEPTVTPNLQAGDAGAGFRLVQLAGPTNDAWLARLEANGLRVLQYYPHNSFLVWGDAAAAARAANLEFVRWQGAFHPAYKINSDLQGRTGLINNVDIMFYNDGDPRATLATIAQLGGNVVQYYPSQPDKMFFDAIVQLDADAVESIAQMNTVLWLGYASPEAGLEDEMSSQILAGNYTGGVPFTGYYDWINDVGYDGSGVIWGIIDTGVDYDHPDLGPHIVSGYSYPGACNPAGQPGSDCSGGGHGTHVAGIVGGDATAGYTDASGFLYGLGVAPGYSIFASNSLSAPAWPPTGGWQEHSKNAVIGGAIGGNNSWTTGEGTQHGYQASERTHDIMVRDGNFDTTSVAEPFIEVFSAGNSGFSGLTSPKEGKNLIVIASSVNYRAGNIENISSFSSRGPAVDGRWVPTVAAPGEEIASARNDLGGSCSTAIPGTNNLYAFCSGTSMAAPHASGAITLSTEWWRTFNNGADPSPAMAKALLVNGAVDMGTPDIPNINEGWGRINTDNIVNNPLPTEYYDQEMIFGNTGEQWTLSVGVADLNQPLKITLAWSDAPGAVGANPALVNNLDLTVINGGNTYHGNVFANGWSATGGSADTINNLENVYVQNPQGSVTIVVDAINISGDGVPYNGDTTDQDFALICNNCVLFPDFTLTAAPSSRTICTPNNAYYNVSVGSLLGFSDPVSLSVSGLPGGAASNFSVNPVTPPGSSMMTIGNTGGAAPGNYTLTITGMAPTSTHTTDVNLSVYNAAPGAPTLIGPVGVDQPLVPTFTWNAASQSAIYLLVVKNIGTGEVRYAVTPDTSYTFGSPLDPYAIHAWSVRAYNPCGTGSFAQFGFFRTQEIPPILLVDDDDNNPDVRASYTDVLDGLGLLYDVWDTANTDNEPDVATLLQYDVVIWFTGDEFGGAAGPGGATEGALGTYLDAGNCLFISSQDYLYDRGLTAFMSNYLGLASGANDSGNYTSVTGQGTVYGGLGPYTLGYPFTDYSDIFNPAANAELAFIGNNGNGAAIAKDSGVYKTTFWGYPFEALPAGDRGVVMQTTLSWCGQ